MALKCNSEKKITDVCFLDAIVADKKTLLLFNWEKVDGGLSALRARSKSENAIKSSSLIKRCEVLNRFCRAYGFELIDKTTIDHILKFETIKLNEEI